jgi:HSP20 family protein
MAEVAVQKSSGEVTKDKAKSPATTGSSHPLLALREQMDRLFDDFFSGFSLSPFGRRPEMDPWRTFQGALGMAYPALDAAETDKEYRLTAELPGMTDKDVEVTLANGTLTLKGEKKEEKEQRDEGFYLSERRYGSFHRALRLPDDVDAAKITANLSNGVLTVTMPKAADAAAKHRKIDIKAAA